MLSQWFWSFDRVDRRNQAIFSSLCVCVFWTFLIICDCIPNKISAVSICPHSHLDKSLFFFAVGMVVHINSNSQNSWLSKQSLISLSLDTRDNQLKLVLSTSYFNSHQFVFFWLTLLNRSILIFNCDLTRFPIRMLAKTENW